MIETKIQVFFKATTEIGKYMLKTDEQRFNEQVGLELPFTDNAPREGEKIIVDIFGRKCDCDEEYISANMPEYEHDNPEEFCERKHKLTKELKNQTYFIVSKVIHDYNDNYHFIELWLDPIDLY